MSLSSDDDVVLSTAAVTQNDDFVEIDNVRTDAYNATTRTDKRNATVDAAVQWQTDTFSDTLEQARIIKQAHDADVWRLSDEQVQATRRVVVVADEQLGDDWASRDEPWKGIARTIADQIELHLWSWDQMHVESLPQSSFTQAFDYPRRPRDESMHSLAVDTDGSLRKLSPKQRDQIRESGTFDVESHAFPGRTHTWRLTNWIQRGRVNTLHDFRVRFSWALYMLVVFFARLFRMAGKAIWCLGPIIRDLLNLLLGIPRTSKRFYTKHLRERELNTRRRQVIFDQLRPVYQMAQLNADGSIEHRGMKRCFAMLHDTLIDIRPWSNEKYNKLNTIVADIQQRHEEVWRLRKNQLLEQLCQQEEGLGMDTHTHMLIGQVCID
jgi:hypothetical protein